METIAVLIAVATLLIAAAFIQGRRSGEAAGREEGFRKGYEYARREKPKDTVSIPLPDDLR